MLNSLQTLTQCLRQHQDTPTNVTPSHSHAAEELVNSMVMDPFEENRPTTPLVVSKHEPLPSMGGRGRGPLGTLTSGCGQVGVVSQKSEMDILNESTVDSQHQLVQAEDK